MAGSEGRFCECDDSRPASMADEQPEGVTCGGCTRVMVCEFGDVDHAATRLHVDYIVCAEHLGDAASNVADRWM